MAGAYREAMDLETLSTMATVIGAIASLAVYMHRENHRPVGNSRRS